MRGAIRRIDVADVTARRGTLDPRRSLRRCAASCARARSRSDRAGRRRAVICIIALRGSRADLWPHLIAYVLPQALPTPRCCWSASARWRC